MYHTDYRILSLLNSFCSILSIPQTPLQMEQNVKDTGGQQVLQRTLPATPICVGQIKMDDLWLPSESTPVF